MKYRNAQENKVTDALSRLPLRNTERGREVEGIIATVIRCVTKAQLQQETADDTVLKTAKKYTTTTWPLQKSLAPVYIPHCEVWKDVFDMNKLLLRHDRIVTPKRLTSSLGQLAHEIH